VNLNVLKSFLKSTKITWKLTILYALIFSFVLISLNASVLFGVQFFLTNQTKQKVNITSITITEKIKTESNQAISLEHQDLIGDVHSDSTISIRIFTPEGMLINAAENFDLKLVPIPTGFNSIKEVEDDNDHFIVENRKIISNGQVKAYLQVIGNMEKENIFLKILFVLMAVSDFVGVAISLVAGYLVSKNMLHPIDKIAKTAQSISINNLNTRIEVREIDDELSRLAQTFNEMIDRLQDSFEKQNQFVSDASHELRTPISVIQGYIGLIDRWGKDDELVLQESIDAIKNETTEMTALIEKLLFLAHGESGNKKIQKSLFSLSDLMNEITKESQLISPTHLFQNMLGEDISIFADRKMLKQIFRALIDNSIKFSPTESTITLSANEDLDFINISIADQGIGISEMELSRIFDRFYRVDKDRSRETGGSGLGLSIVKWIVSAHNGQIIAHNNKEVGLTITVKFPTEKNI
jgi:two-component system sensor histidine kinase ArlS